MEDDKTTDGWILTEEEKATIKRIVNSTPKRLYKRGVLCEWCKKRSATFTVMCAANDETPVCKECRDEWEVP